MEPFIFDGVNWLIFCEAGNDVERRIQITTPFIRDGYLYATDGIICLRRSADGLEPFNPERTLPQSLPLADFEAMKDIEADFWRDWPTGATSMPVYESRCGCRFDSRLSAPVECCPTCGGHGSSYSVDWNEGVKVNGNYIRLDNWRRVSLLPGVRYADPRRDDGPILLRFKGGEGLVMPMDRPGSRDKESK